MITYSTRTETDSNRWNHLLTTVLIIDHDLGFVFWLGHALDKLGYSALPAKSVPDAALLVMQLDLKVDVLVVDLALPGAPDFVAALHRSQRQVRVIGILNDPPQVIHLPGVSATHSKPVHIDPAAEADWIDCIERVAGNTTTQSTFN